MQQLHGEKLVVLKNIVGEDLLIINCMQEERHPNETTECSHANKVVSPPSWIM